ncbi:MAG: hypothetical protein ACOYNN_18960, partial [Terrimicrobiaceae bacterium]
MTHQEFTHKGTANWGGRLTFELGALQMGDLLQSVGLQIRLGHWYSEAVRANIADGTYVVDPSSNPWTYINSLGTSIIEYAAFEVGDQTIEYIDGAFVKAYSALIPDANMLFGFSTDGYGITSLANVANNTAMMNPNRPWPTQDGVYFCLLPFSFMRTRQKEVFPLVACAEGSVRVHVQLRNFADCVRSSQGFRESCTSTPLGLTTNFLIPALDTSAQFVNSTVIPPIQDF